jgi:hypothetical protein
MQIISKFRDYYDAVQREGQDRSPVFMREVQRFIGVNAQTRIEQGYG